MQTSKAKVSTRKPRVPKTPKVKYRRMTITKNRACTKDVYRDLYHHPEDLSTISHFNVNELDAEYLRKLLSLNMPNLEGINLKARSNALSMLDEGRKRELNSRMDVPLFPHPTLTTLKLWNLTIDALARSSVRPLPFENLDSFYLHARGYSHEVLNKFLKNAKSLRHLEFHHPFDVRPHSDPPDFSDLLQPCKRSLKILELWWDCTDHLSFNSPGMKFAECTALQYLAIPPTALFGPYWYKRDLDFLQMLKDHIPPNLKVLFLQDIYPCWSEEPLPPDCDPEAILLPNDHKLIKTLLINIELFPALRYIAWTSEIGTIPPEDLDDMAGELGITLEWMTNRSELPPDVKWLDSL
ncbi:uncharacterized protein FPRO_07309 [Fusarium proliferatum ET1]|uniref:F-box domain protein n=1 Tax=Fusarium proliferatum (strain ET1) TaxID=1227346 RepID=A0A1L7VTP0_FUSPR|nr:uncharacterized protein FPRO_07309 [Fusarium proliferatum ET1]CZR43774.1 uncharacterized protein FPRO_07309 [Fusarium proliferatum ET1]